MLNFDKKALEVAVESARGIADNCESSRRCG